MVDTTTVDDLVIISSPEEAGMDASRWSQVLHLAQRLSQTVLPGLAFQVTVRGKTAGEYQFGRQASSPSSRPLSAHSIFLSASLTKPVVAMGVLRLVERGLISLSDPVVDYLPQITDPGKKGLTIRHLLTHTSGLPDQLLNNRALRMTRSPLQRFVDGACTVSLDFPPGRGVQYQSMGFVLLGAIMEAVTQIPLPRLLHQELFQPLRMKDTVLGATDDWLEAEERQSRLAQVVPPDEQQGGDDWNWNSRYWHQLGAPWGGMLTTTTDMILFSQMMLDGGASGLNRVFSNATIQAATTNQLASYPDLPEADRRCRPWGLGWRMNWPTHTTSFGDLLSQRAYGHWGATGTLHWIDPERQAAAVLLSTLPLDKGSGPALTRLSNAIVSAIR
ncbi:MAG: class A beta-lactamase-related serine hydrolase [Planctomycetota bacterium]|nr:MAG: class A beta-lactamase-related serine hydrolase [Planctomycetota bacterium]